MFVIILNGFWSNAFFIFFFIFLKKKIYIYINIYKSYQFQKIIWFPCPIYLLKIYVPWYAEMSKLCIWCKFYWHFIYVFNVSMFSKEPLPVCSSDQYLKIIIFYCTVNAMMICVVIEMVILHVNRYFWTCCWFFNPRKTWSICIHNFTYF
jgi:hypothetical protein